jgi:hypothetical protein
MHCAECFHTFTPEDKRFAILTVTQPVLNYESGEFEDRVEQRIVCEDCAGWHSTSAIEVPEGVTV